MWGRFYERVNSSRTKYAARDYNINFDILNKEGLLTPSSIPKIADLNVFLKERTNWQVQAVGKGVTHREFLNALALRTFCLNMYMRDDEHAIESDILHQMLGHVPNLLDSNLREVSQRIG